MANEQSKIVVSFTEDSPVLKAMAYTLDIARKAGFNPLKGEHSVQYWAEEFIQKANDYYKGAIERDNERRNKDAYIKAEALITVPVPGCLPEAWVRYGQELQNLRRKYGIGGKQVEV